MSVHTDPVRKEHRRRQARWWWVALLLAALLGAACGDDDDSVESDKPATEDTAGEEATGPADDEGGGATVELLEAGAEPRSPLRLTVTAGSEQRTVMTTRTAIKQSLAGQDLPVVPVPAIEFLMKSTVAGIDPDGTIDVAFTYETAKLAEGETAEPAVVAQIAKMAGLKIDARMTPRGQLLTAETDIPADLDPTVRSVLENLESQLEGISVAFPEEPVGVGASWRADRTAEILGIETKMAVTYRLVERTDSGYKLAVEVTQTVPEGQEADFPGLPDDATVTVKSWAITGTGETVGNLAALLPLSGSQKTGGDMTLEFSADGETGELLQNLEIELSFASPA